jgi:mono/diheme cytochrome c family protein
MAQGQATAHKPPPLVLQSMAGRDLFDFYCAPCHGRDGKGHGPIARALTSAPADLTAIAAANSGIFPREDVRAMIVGERALVPAHGEQNMPVWGPIFRGLDPNDTRNRTRVSNIVAYITSLQSK